MKAPQKYEEMKKFKQLEDELYYKSGDKFIFDSRYITGGFLSSGRTIIYFTIITPKSLKNIHSVKTKSIYVNLRDKQGYIYNEKTPTDTRHILTDFSTIETSIATDNSIAIALVKSGGYHINNATTNADNNSVIAVELNSIELEFSDVANDESNNMPEIFD